MIFESLQENQLSLYISNEIVNQLHYKMDSTLFLSCSEDLKETYEDTVLQYQLGNVNFRLAKIFSLGEFITKNESPKSCRNFLKTHLTNRVNIDQDNIFIPDVKLNPKKAIKIYTDEIIKAKGIDLLILSLGKNGSIGFNEPGVDHKCSTHVADLLPASLNEKFAPVDDDIPSQAIALGLSEMFNARKIILLIHGEEKVGYYRALKNGVGHVSFPVTPLYGHSNFTIVTSFNESDL